MLPIGCGFLDYSNLSKKMNSTIYLGSIFVACYLLGLGIILDIDMVCAYADVEGFFFFDKQMWKVCLQLFNLLTLFMWELLWYGIIMCIGYCMPVKNNLLLNL